MVPGVRKGPLQSLLDSVRDRAYCIVNNRGTSKTCAFLTGSPRPAEPNGI